METDLSQLLHAYTELREQGSEPKAVLSVLRTRIQALAVQDRDKFGKMVRNYEVKQSQAQPSTTVQETEQTSRDTQEMYDAFITRNFGDAPPVDNDEFGPSTMLMLRIKNNAEVIAIWPQQFDREIVVGRQDKNGVVEADVDLTGFGAAQHGVSRLHMAISYDANQRRLHITDLDSQNGLFVNGQRLAPHEVRMLRSGDELKLGHMEMSVAYRHWDGSEQN